VTTGALKTLPGGRSRVASGAHPVVRMIGRRVGLGVLTLLFVSILVFLATQVLPGNAATAVLQNTATPARVHALELQLHLNDSVPSQYWHWISGLLRGDPGTSLANRQSVSSIVGPRIFNSAVLVVLAGVLGTLIGTLLGVVAAARRDGWLDHGLSVIALVVTALPEFVVAVVLVIVFSTLVLHLLPAVAVFPPSVSALNYPNQLVLPIATLVLVIVPYIFRMTRGAMIEALASDFIEMAELKGLSRRRVLLVHAFLEAIPTTIQVVGLNLLYLAGGIVVVEYVFNFPGIGQELVAAVSDRDIPVIQFTVLLLAGFYVFVNIISDVLALLVTPRRRLPRSG
jgi:peptide/nickel transport system permease protein